MSNSDPGDPRAALYTDLHTGQLRAEEEQNRKSARLVFDILSAFLTPASMLDVGCGIGTWVSAALECGITDVLGVDGPWLDQSSVVCDPKLVRVCDLQSGIDLKRRFDLVTCIEVAEHLSPSAAEPFIESLTRHSAAVLFSAAIPGQGGHGHINEQFLSYWCAMFGRHGYLPLDIIRGAIWDDAAVQFWLRQNLVLFAHRDLVAGNDALRLAAEELPKPLSVVHPQVYAARINGLASQLRTAKQRLDQLAQLEATLRAEGGGEFRTQIDADNRLVVTRVGAQTS